MVNDIQLCLIRVRVQNSNGLKGVLTPVWMFYGKSNGGSAKSTLPVSYTHLVFSVMNTASYDTAVQTDTITVTDEYGAIVLDENGEAKTTEKTTLYIYVELAAMSYEQDVYKRQAGSIVPFEDKYPAHTELYRLMTTKPNEKFVMG